MAALQLSWAALPLLASLPVLAAACIADVRRRIIPDWTVVAMAAIGAAAAVGLGQPGPALIAAAASAGIGVGLALLGVWGWGDAKMLGSAGLLVGTDGLFTLANVMVMTGGGLALLLLLLRAPVRSGRLPLPATAPRWLAAEHRRLRRAPSVPYALAIAAGILAGMVSP